MPSTTILAIQWSWSSWSLLRPDRVPRTHSIKLVRCILVIASPPPVVLGTAAPGEMVDIDPHVLQPLAEETPPPRCSDRIRSTSEHPRISVHRCLCSPSFKHTNDKPVIPPLAQLPETLPLFAASSSSWTRTCTAPGQIIDISATLNPTGATVSHITPFDVPIPSRPVGRHHSRPSRDASAGDPEACVQPPYLTCSIYIIFISLASFLSDISL
ncbi:hypothetical protein FB45DRAFT_902263 [Roridomyces roridus]|uniref:Uncharacterized protein n=1 Tax=Roridomyces roridus TaxID=1738132 RepID=A0AAD7FTB8_9AGAR|nr:hypothetical protein FB45DRAFT_902263 [Roridomyces roridus]